MEVSSRYHLGHLLLDHIKDHLDVVGQIDAATKEKRTYGAALSRSIKLARSLRVLGYKPGDIVAVGGRNNLDIHIPFYASVFNGLPLVGVDPYFKYDEIYKLFELTKPKLAFCQRDFQEVYERVAADLGLQMKIITFDGDCNISDIIEMYDTKELEQDFKPEEFDIEKINVFLIPTSGSTGKLKIAVFKHGPFMLKMLEYFKVNKERKVTKKRTLYLSPVQWISSYFICFFSPITGDTKIQTSRPDDIDHIIEMINDYKPQSGLFSPTLVSTFLSRKDEVDLTCFEIINVVGSKFNPDAFEKFKKQLSENCLTLDAYGQTEMIGPILMANRLSPPGSCGKAIFGHTMKLVDPDSGLEIKEPNVTGEMWAKGYSFAGYYNDPEETRLAFSKDGYYKTGDLLYRDEDGNYFFVDRIKSLIKYRNYIIIPSELEDVIRLHTSVKDVCVVGIKDPVDGERPVACVVKKDNCDVTAKEIKDLVESKLSKNKALSGGVVFLDTIPLTSTGKLAKKVILQIVSNSNRE